MSTSKKSQRKNALGRGLNALLNDSLFLTDPAATSPMSEIAIEQIQVNPFQPRKDFDPASLEELSASIQLHGIIQPITVRQLGPASYQLISGERRLQASKLAQLKKVPAYVRTADDQQMLEMALIENIQRENLNPIEIALSYQRLLTECQIKQEVLGDRVGKNRTTVNNYLRLLKLPPDIQIALRDQKISMGHARALVNVESASAQLRFFNEILTRDLSVRQVEALVRGAAEKKATGKAASGGTMSSQMTQIVHEAKGQLARQLGAPVKIQMNAKEKGEIRIAFANAKELDKILRILKNV